MQSPGSGRGILKELEKRLGTGEEPLAQPCQVEAGGKGQRMGSTASPHGVLSPPPGVDSRCWGYIESCEARIAPWVQGGRERMQGSRRGHLALPLPHQLHCLLPLKAQPPGMGGMGN